MLNQGTAAVCRLSAIAICLLFASALSAQTAAPDSLRVLAEAQDALGQHLSYVRPVSPRSSRAAVESRPVLIERLDELGEKIPGDEWIAGHRVGFRIMHGELSAARETAMGCRSTPWWCSALLGFVLHLQQEYEAADQVFDLALATMPRVQRCLWVDEIERFLLSGDFRREFGSMDCNDKLQLERHVWWLADPFHVMPGNDRRTEHYARLVAMRLHHETLHLDDQPCRDSHHEAQIKQGWPEWWWSVEATVTDLRPGDGFRFMPSSDVALRPLFSTSQDWSLSPESRGERYNPAYGPVYDLENQAAFFLREDSLLVLTAVEIGRDPLFSADSVAVALAVTSSESDDPRVFRSQRSGTRHLLAGMLSPSRYLLSIEAVSEGYGAARSRFGHELPSSESADVRVSDLLLWDWRDGVSENLDSIAGLMVGTTRLESTRPIGLYWELYGVRPGEALQIEFVATPRERGFVRALAQRFRVADPDERLRFRWDDTARENSQGIVGRTLEIDLSLLPAGEYTLEIGVSGAFGRTTTTRDIRLAGGIQE